jgi:small subunit ribosomal protein S4
MGAPRRIRKKFSGPSHPWQKERIEEEKGLLKEYGLKNKTEIWKTTSKLRNFKKQTKNIIRTKTKQSEKEKVQLLTKLISLGLIQENTNIEEVLGLAIKNILERRLQTLVFRKGLARSMKQARQFITHRHILVNNKKITSPCFLVSKNLEDKILFSNSSSLFSPEHPERVQQKKTQEKKEKKDKEGSKKQSQKKKEMPKKGKNEKNKEGLEKKNAKK